MFFFKKNKAKKNQVIEFLEKLDHKIEMRFKELTTQVNELEKKLLIKDLKDKQTYGMLHYKIHEMDKEEKPKKSPTKKPKEH